MSKVYVFGHKSPDTDATASTIVYNNFLKNNGVESVAVKIDDINNETKYVLENTGIDIPETITKDSIKDGDAVVLMDHNEATQSIEGIEDIKILEIVDHHKFNLKTKEPLNITARPVGAACTVVSDIILNAGYEVSQTEAKLLISGIISDTLFFRSPTTTDDDKYFVNELNEIAEIDDLEKYSLEMFAAKSDLGEISAKDLVKSDYKVFEFAGKNYGIGVLETTNPDYALGRIDETINAMKEIKSEDNLAGIFLSVVDILNEKNITILCDEDSKKLAEKIFDKTAEDSGSTIELGAVVSRKKQIVPAFEKFFS